MKLRSAEEDVSDLQTEFELERQDYLDTIRTQVYTLSARRNFFTFSSIFTPLYPHTGAQFTTPRAAAGYNGRSGQTRLQLLQRGQDQD